MPIVTNNQYRLWLKSAANMKLYSNESVLRITYEGLTNFQSFMDFDRDSIGSISKDCSNNIDAIVAYVPNGIATNNAIWGTNISMIPIRQLVVATNAVKYYTSIGGMPKFDNTHYINVLGEYSTDYNAYILLNKKTSS